MGFLFIFFTALLHFQALAFECDPKCYGSCTGPTAFDCNFCVHRAHRNQDGECICDDYWTGKDCSTFISNFDRCHDRCYKCVGPTIYDCIGCVSNASKNEYDICLCNSGWNGDDCSLLGNYKGKCFPTCQECSGSQSYECITCVENAERDEVGNCNCGAFWGGNDCSNWLGTCDAKCLHGCDGPTAHSCYYCVYNSHLVDGECLCDDGWGGEDCSQWIASCHPVCKTCSGPSADECLYCVEHASKDEYGVCKCDHFWEGDDCTLYTYIGQCALRCRSCSGPSATDCNVCIENAYFDENNTCICSEFWSGMDCSIYLYSGTCHSICKDNICTGPSAGDCHQCVEHAHRNSSKICVCDNYWIGDDCSIKNYTGHCHSYCDVVMGCVGSTPKDCIECVDNAVFDEESGCSCQQNWYGSRCEVYTQNDCDSKCIGCDGPQADQCTECVENAHKDNQGFCICDNLWAGQRCDVYMAPCHPICDGCHGPKTSDCEFCIEHAHWEFNPFLDIQQCQCNTGYSGEDCDEFVDSCNHMCDSCHGPRDSDCDFCIENAHFDSRNFCICDLHWTGQKCKDFIGSCHSVCETCNGPGPQHCIACVKNASENEHGECECNLHWSGPNCAQYVGPCEERCNGCHGPYASDCNSCVENAEFTHENECVCMHNYSGEVCQLFVGQCADICLGCTGLTDVDCVQCKANAFRDQTGRCICYPGWKGAECQDYAGECSPKCLSGCKGPLDTQCIDCVHNSKANRHGQCVCNDTWEGLACTLYNGPCHTNCVGCIGPLASDCELCVENSHRDLTGSCLCNDGWSGVRCSQYQGDCYETCQGGCSGPSAYDCNACIPHSGRGKTGRCDCLPSWGGSTCQQYKGSCGALCEGMCSGPTNADCQSCRLHSEIRDETCTCIEPWVGDTCDIYSGICHPLCRGCTGPEASDCIYCRGNAKYNSLGLCSCEHNWSGPLCDIFTLCDPICEECTGPGRFLCTACNANAHRSEVGECTCNPDWTGPACEQYIGICNSLCELCTGPGLDQCIDCVENAMLSHMGHCTCKEGWIGSTCNVWRGECDSRCSRCLGPTDSDCVQCVKNAYWDQGRCVCIGTYFGDACAYRTPTCHESCATCNGPEVDACDTCAAGYVHMGNLCVACAPTCKSCELYPDQCSDCHAGSFLTSNSECQKWDSSCKSCSADGPTSCLSCGDDSTFTAESGLCRCKGEAVRHPATNNCAKECPSGLKVIPATGLCEVQKNHLVTFDLDVTIPQYDKFYKQSLVTSCDPPKTLPLRGALFNGANNFLTIDNFEAHSTNSMGFIAKIRYSGTLMAYTFKAKHDYETELSTVQMHLLASDCGQFVYDFSDQISTIKPYSENTWYHITIQTEGHLHRTTVLIKINSILLSHLSTEYTYYSQNGGIYLGSHFRVNNFSGFIYSWSYYPHVFDWDDFDQDFCFKNDVCLSNCGWDEYADSTENCHTCHPSCSDGCGDNLPCVSCDSQCLTCVAGTSDDCTSCRCNAVRSFSDDIYGACTCADGYDLDNGVCTKPCEAGCAVCDLQGTCFTCAESYHLHNGTCDRCNEPNAPFMPGLPICKEKNLLKTKGICLCDPDKIFDNFSCNSCVRHCKKCDSKKHCAECDIGSYFLPNSDICTQVVPSGLKIVGQVLVVAQTTTNTFKFNKDDSKRDFSSLVSISKIIANSGEKDTVFGHATRGLWFDGKNSILDLLSYIFYHTFTIDMWVAPAKSGTLISAATQNGQRRSTLFHFTVRDEMLEFEETSNHFYFNSGKNSVTMRDWQHIAVTAHWNDDSKTDVQLFSNAQAIAKSSYFGYIFEDTGDIEHFIGAEIRNGRFFNLYRGYIYSFRTSVKALTDFSDQITRDCGGGCNVCPLGTRSCLGTCKWNEVMFNGVCTTCPSHCKHGCWSGGEEPWCW